jgi:hypothetical protein
MKSIRSKLLARACRNRCDRLAVAVPILAAKYYWITVPLIAWAILLLRYMLKKRKKGHSLCGKPELPELPRGGVIA